MPHQNRVDPWGRVVATAERGTLMGNRGVLHDDRGAIVRNQQVRRWIACEVSFRGRRRPLLRPGRYTELFFLDEATALAAGHRPCFECRRDDARRFAEAWRLATGAASPPRAGKMDDVLDAARRGPRVQGRVDGLPRGAMFEAEDHAWVVTRAGARRWSFGGYEAARPSGSFGSATMLTPVPIVAVLAAAYEPRLHETISRRG